MKRKYNAAAITSYFQRVSNSAAPGSSSVTPVTDVTESPSSVQSPVSISSPETDAGSILSGSSTVQIDFEPPAAEPLPSADKEREVFSVDIGDLAGTRPLSSAEMRQLANNLWKPEPDYKFLTTERNGRGKVERRCLNARHFDTFPWLAFSRKTMGAFCLPCVMFSRQEQRAKSLVKEPLKKFDLLTDNLSGHDEREYHKTAVMKLQHFRSTLSSGVDISVKMQTAKSKENKENRKRLAVIMAVYLPLLEHMQTELARRFGPHQEKAMSLSHLLPNVIWFQTWDDIKEAVDMYRQCLPLTLSDFCMRYEFDLWKKKWENNADLPSTAMDALNQCDVKDFQSINPLLQILATLPVSTATAERSFSTLKRLKTYLRSTMGDE